MPSLKASGTAITVPYGFALHFRTGRYEASFVNFIGLYFNAAGHLQQPSPEGQAVGLPRNGQWRHEVKYFQAHLF